VVAFPGLQIDPYVVLDVGHDASLEEIRDAYRKKAKLYHPDVGGDERIFRILAQAYEYLSTSRVARASWTEAGTWPPAEVAPRWNGRADEADTDLDETDGDPGGDDGAEPEVEKVYPGLQEVTFDPVTLVEVEKLWIRLVPQEPGQVAAGLLDDRFLSCNLNLSWPEESLEEKAPEIPDVDEHLRKLAEVFEEVRTLTQVQDSNSQVLGHRFVGWLSYSNMNQASIAFRQLRESLHGAGFRLKPRTRDLNIPGEWR